MISFARTARAGIASLLLIATALHFTPARADDGFPFETQMQLDVNRMPGSKRIPNLDIGEAGEVAVETLGKGGKGPVLGAGDTALFFARGRGKPSRPPGRRRGRGGMLARRSGGS